MEFSDQMKNIMQKESLDKVDSGIRRLVGHFLTNSLGWVNCVILTQYPQRKSMLLEAIASFQLLNYDKKILTIVNDGYRT